MTNILARLAFFSLIFASFFASASALGRDDGQAIVVENTNASALQTVFAHTKWGVYQSSYSGSSPGRYNFSVQFPWSDRVMYSGYLYDLSLSNSSADNVNRSRLSFWHAIWSAGGTTPLFWERRSMVHIDSDVSSAGRNSPYNALVQSSLYVYNKDWTYSSSIALKSTQLKIWFQCYMPWDGIAQPGNTWFTPTGFALNSDIFGFGANLNLTLFQKAKIIHQGNYITYVVTYNWQKKIVRTGNGSDPCTATYNYTIPPSLATCDPDGVNPQSCSCRTTPDTYGAPTSMALMGSVPYDTLTYTTGSTSSLMYENIRTSQRAWYQFTDPVVWRVEIKNYVSGTGANRYPPWFFWTDTTFNTPSQGYYWTGLITDMPGTALTWEQATFSFLWENTKFNAIKLKKWVNWQGTGTVRDRVKIVWTDVDDNLVQWWEVDLENLPSDGIIYFPDTTTNAKWFTLYAQDGTPAVNIAWFSIGNWKIIKWSYICDGLPPSTTSSSLPDIPSISNSLSNIPLIWPLLSAIFAPIETWIRNTLGSVISWSLSEWWFTRTFAWVPDISTVSYKLKIPNYTPSGNISTLTGVTVYAYTGASLGVYSMFETQSWTYKNTFVAMILAFFYSSAKLIISFLPFAVIGVFFLLFFFVYDFALPYLTAWVKQENLKAWWWYIYAVYALASGGYILWYIIPAFGISGIVSSMFNFTDFLFTNWATVLGVYSDFSPMTSILGIMYSWLFLSTLIFYIAKHTSNIT